MVFSKTWPQQKRRDRGLSDPPELEMVPAEDGDHPGGAGEPGQPDHHERPLLRPAAQVAQRRCDGPVPDTPELLNTIFISKK